MYPTLKIKIKEIHLVSKGNAVILCEVNPRKKNSDCEFFFHAIDYYRYPSKIKKGKIYKVMFDALPFWLKIYTNEKDFIKNSWINKEMNKSRKKEDKIMFSPTFFVPSGMFGRKKSRKEIESIADVNFAGHIKNYEIIQGEKKTYYRILVKTFFGIIRVDCLKSDLQRSPKKGQILEGKYNLVGTFNLK
jgi:uncharacterized membrane protein YkoI